MYLADEMGNKLEVEMFLKEEVALEEHKGIKEKIQQMDEVKSVEYIDKDEAREIAETFIGDSTEIIDSLPENPLPASFIITLKDPNDIYDVAKELEGWKEQEEVKVGKHANDLLLASKELKKYGNIATIVIALVTIFMIGNAIKNNIIERSNEIETKKLIGASMLTIRVPFILEAITITLIAAGMTYATIYYGYDQIVHLVRGTLPFLPLLESNAVVNGISVYLFLFALIVGFLGSFTSVKKHVKKY